MATGITNLAFTLHVFCFTFFLLSFATPWWTSAAGYSSGLWLECTKHMRIWWRCNKLFDTEMWRDDERIHGTQAMMCVALATHTVAFILYIRTMCRDKLDTQAPSFFCLAAGLMTIIAIVMYIAVYHEEKGLLSWSFMMAAVSGGLGTLNGVVTVLLERL